MHSLARFSPVHVDRRKKPHAFKSFCQRLMYFFYLVLVGLSGFTTALIDFKLGTTPLFCFFGLIITSSIGVRKIIKD